MIEGQFLFYFSNYNNKTCRIINMMRSMYSTKRQQDFDNIYDESSKKKIQLSYGQYLVRPKRNYISDHSTMEFLPPVVQVSKDDYQITKKSYRGFKDSQRLIGGKLDFRERATRSVDRGVRLPNVTDFKQSSDQIEDSMDSIKFIRQDSVDLSDLRDKYKFALKLLKSHHEYSDGIALITEIDESLKESTDDSLDKLDLHLLVSRQIGLRMQQKAQYQLAIDYYTQAIDICQKMKIANLDSENNDLEIDICEIKHSICKCRYKLKQFLKCQKEIVELTERAQLIVDLEESKKKMTPNYERAILVFTKASNLQGEILENKNQNKQANKIYKQSIDLLRILQEKSFSEEVNRLATQLQRSIYRTQLQMKINKVKQKMPALDVSMQRSSNNSPSSKDLRNSQLQLSGQKSPYRQKYTSAMDSRMDHASSRTQDRSTAREHIYQAQTSPHFLKENRGLKDYKLCSSQMFSQKMLSEYNEQDRIHSSADFKNKRSPLLSHSETQRMDLEQPYLTNFDVYKHTEILARNMAGYGKSSSVTRNSSWQPQHNVRYYRPMLERERWSGLASMKTHMQRYNMYQISVVDLQKQIRQTRIGSPIDNRSPKSKSRSPQQSQFRNKSQIRERSILEIQKATSGSRERKVRENKERAKERIRQRRAKGRLVLQGAKNWKKYKYFQVDTEKKQLNINESPPQFWMSNIISSPTLKEKLWHDINGIYGIHKSEQSIDEITENPMALRLEQPSTDRFERLRATDRHGGLTGLPTTERIEGIATTSRQDVLPSTGRMEGYPTNDRYDELKYHLNEQMTDRLHHPQNQSIDKQTMHKMDKQTIRRSDMRVIQRSDMALNQDSERVPTIDENLQAPIDRNGSHFDVSVAELTQEAIDSVQGKESQGAEDLHKTITIHQQSIFMERQNAQGRGSTLKIKQDPIIILGQVPSKQEFDDVTNSQDFESNIKMHKMGSQPTLNTNVYDKTISIDNSHPFRKESSPYRTVKTRSILNSKLQQKSRISVLDPVLGYEKSQRLQQNKSNLSVYDPVLGYEQSQRIHQNNNSNMTLIDPGFGYEQQKNLKKNQSNMAVYDPVVGYENHPKLQQKGSTMAVHDPILGYESNKQRLQQKPSNLALIDPAFKHDQPNFMIQPQSTDRSVVPQYPHQQNLPKPPTSPVPEEPSVVEEQTVVDDQPTESKNDKKKILIDPIKKEISSIQESINSQKLVLANAHTTLSEHTQKQEHLIQEQAKLKKELREKVDEREQARNDIRTIENVRRPTVASIISSGRSLQQDDEGKIIVDVYREKISQQEYKTLDESEIIKKQKDEVIRRIRDVREYEFIKVAIAQLRDRLEEKLLSAKMYASQIEALNKLEKEVKQKNKHTAQAKFEFSEIVQDVYVQQNKIKGSLFGKDKTKVDKSVLDEYVQEKVDSKIQEIYAQVDEKKIETISKKVVATFKQIALQQQEIDQHKDEISKVEKQEQAVRQDVSKAKKDWKKQRDKLQKLEQKIAEYEIDLEKVESMEGDLVSKYLDETFYHKQIQYEEAIREIEKKSYKSSRNESRPTVSQDVSRPSKADSTFTRSNYFDNSTSELSQSQTDETPVDLDTSQIDNFYEIKRLKDEKRKQKEERRESLFHQFDGSRLNQKFNEFAARSASDFKKKEEKQMQEIRKSMKDMIQARMKGLSKLSKTEDNKSQGLNSAPRIRVEMKR